MHRIFLPALLFSGLFLASCAPTMTGPVTPTFADKNIALGQKWLVEVYTVAGVVKLPITLSNTYDRGNSYLGYRIPEGTFNYDSANGMFGEFISVIWKDKTYGTYGFCGVKNPSRASDPKSLSGHFTWDSNEFRSFTKESSGVSNGSCILRRIE